MPELAEVEYYRKQWAQGLGDRIERVYVNESSRVFRDELVASIAPALTKAKFLASFTHGKHLLFQFSGEVWLGGHLGMTGELLTAPPTHAPAKHDHLVLYQKRRALIFQDPRMFGRIRIHSGKNPPPWWQALPPEILSEGYTMEFLANFLNRHPRSPLKALLLDQAGFPGIGNWMADEVLWRLRRRPDVAAGELSPWQRRRLRTILQDISKKALATIGETWADLPAKTWLMPHRWKDGGTCPRCRSALVREELRGRTTCWCPRCQI